MEIESVRKYCPSMPRTTEEIIESPIRHSYSKTAGKLPKRIKADNHGIAKIR